ncbi:MAG: hypothetical protein QE278_03830 [Limnobacter sp.]|nr:hypothetical protein [Limnobacter sp.]
MRNLNSIAEVALDLPSEFLPFEILLAEGIEDLSSTAKLRKLAYQRHLPDFSSTLSDDLDPTDTHPSMAVLNAYSKLDKTLLASVRIQVSHSEPLILEQSFALPQALRKGRIAEISRLVIQAKGESLMLRLMLIKACYWYCRFQAVDNAFLCARHPVDRQYRRFELKDVLPNQGTVEMAHIGNIPHRVLWFNVLGLESDWRVSGNATYPLFFEKSHPDILSDVQIKTLQNESSHFVHHSA